MNTNKVAVVSSDGINLDLHFGEANDFIIYELKDGIYKKSDIRAIPPKNIHPNKEGGRIGGCCFRDEEQLEKIAEIISDCEYLLINKIGNHPSRILQRQDVFILETNGTINERLKKLAEYNKK